MAVEREAVTGDTHTWLSSTLFVRVGVAAATILVITTCGNSAQVPDMVGTDEAFARGVAIGAGFTVEIVEEEHEGVEEGQIISQVPAAGETADPESTTITLTVALTPRQALTGTFVLYNGEATGGPPDDCYGTGGYDDIQSGLTVTVRDGSGTTLGTGRLDHGSNDGTHVCVFPFHVADVPAADFYAVEVGHRGELTFSHQEMETQNWQVNLTLG